MKARFYVHCDVIFRAGLQGKFEIAHSWNRKGQHEIKMF